MTYPRKVAVLGATGSIGRSALDVIARHTAQFHASVLVAGRNVKGLVELCRQHQPEHAVIADPTHYVALREGLAALKLNTCAHAGAEMINTFAASESCDTVLAAIVGSAGLSSTLAAVGAGKRLLLANKESLVLAGELLTAQAQRSGADIIPIDSEHNAIFQCLRSRDAGNPANGVRRIMLTASGGPFRGYTRAQLQGINPAQALAHPRWSMGPKISIDSATLMNKGLEVIEAHHLFGLSSHRIDVLVHPQSLVHSLVEFIDGSTLAQLGLPDMRTTLAVGLGWPQRIASGVVGLDLLKYGRLDFEAPDTDTFPCLQQALDALNAGGTAPAVLNAANEVAVAAFLQEKIGFLSISALIAHVMERLPSVAADTLDTLLAADTQARHIAQDSLARFAT